MAPETRAFVTAGLLGGFTTFSAFSFEAVALTRACEWFRAATYSVGSVAIGIGAVFIGLNAAAIVLRARG